MSVQAMAWVLEHSESTLASRLILLAIANHAKADGSDAWPSVATLAAEARVSEIQAHRCIRSLQRLGELAIDKCAGPRGTNIYHLPKVRQLSLNDTPVKMTPESSGSVEGLSFRSEPPLRMTPEPSLELTVLREPSVERKLLAKAARAHQWPPGFALNASLFNYASSKGLAHIEDQFEAFENYHRSKGSKFLDWYRAWYSWVAKTIEWGKNGNGQTRTESFAERQSRRGAEAIQSVLGRYEAPSGDLPRALPPTHD